MASLTGRHRKKIFDRDKWRCHYCRLHVLWDVEHSHPRRATIDHKMPASKGGSNMPGNLVTACNRCNADKGDIAYDHYRWFRHMRMRGHSRMELLESMRLQRSV